MFDTIAGLPLHPLVVHAVEVIVPLAAVAVLLAALWPRFRRWAFALPLLLAVALEGRVGESGAVEVHSQMAERLLPWVIGLVVIAAGLVLMTWWARRGQAGDARGAVLRAVVLVLVVASMVVSTGTIVQAVRIGHSCATAVWGQTASSGPVGGGVGA